MKSPMDKEHSENNEKKRMAYFRRFGVRSPVIQKKPFLTKNATSIVP